MVPASTRIFVYAEPVDMRRSFDALGQCVRDVLKQDPESGGLFIFAGKRGNSLKILCWEWAQRGMTAGTARRCTTRAPMLTRQPCTRSAALGQ
jgi:transposase